MRQYFFLSNIYTFCQKSVYHTPRLLSAKLDQSSLIISDAFSPIMKTIAFVCPVGMTGIMEASTIRSPLTPYTRSLGSTTASGSEDGPILQVPTWWWRLVVNCRAVQAQYSSLAKGKCLQAGNGDLRRRLL